MLFVMSSSPPTVLLPRTVIWSAVSMLEAVAWSRPSSITQLPVNPVALPRSKTFDGLEAVVPLTVIVPLPVIVLPIVTPPALGSSRKVPLTLIVPELDNEPLVV